MSRTVLTELRQCADSQSIFLGVVGLIALGVATGLGATSLLRPEVGLALITAFLCISGAFVRPVLTMARSGPSCIRAVCVVSAGLVIYFLCTFYLAYFTFVGVWSKPSGQLPAAKILDLPPLAAAAWAAATGWYVHFQLTTRNTKVANSVKLVLDTRTNSEFLKRATAVRQSLPTAKDVRAVPTEFYGANGEATALRSLEKANSRLEEIKRRLDIAQAVVTTDTEVQVEDGHARARIVEEISKEDKVTSSEYDAAAEAVADAERNVVLAEAISSLRYLLNFYEFMAVGIKGGDFDEEMIYETISPSIVGHYNRAEVLINFIQKDQNGHSSLAFEHLAVVVDRWSKRLDNEELEKARRH